MGRKTTPKTSTEKEMREIKFRYIRKDEVFTYSLHEIFYGFVSKVILHPEYFAGQFTGLHDKNGKEIYEGDILLCDDDADSYTTAVACNNIHQYGSDIRFNEMNWDGDTHNPFYGGIFNVEEKIVIGNIYQNPELIPHSTAE